MFFNNSDSESVRVPLAAHEPSVGRPRLTSLYNHSFTSLCKLIKAAALYTLSWYTMGLTSE